MGESILGDWLVFSFDLCLFECVTGVGAMILGVGYEFVVELNWENSEYHFIVC